MAAPASGINRPTSLETFQDRTTTARVEPILYNLAGKEPGDWEIAIPAGGTVSAVVQLSHAGPSRLNVLRVAVADAASLLVAPRDVEVQLGTTDGRIQIKRQPLQLLNGNAGGELVVRVPYLCAGGSTVTVQFWNLAAAERRITGFLRAYLFER